jgi:hypothetical protein
MKNSLKISKASKVITTLLSIIFVLVLNSAKSFSQDNASLEGIVYDFVSEGGDETVLQPYADALSSDINSGLFHSAKVKKGFSLYFGIKGIGTYINGDNPVVKNANNTLGILPIAVPQVQVGSLFGTELSFRVLPTVTLGKYGSVNMWGIGIKHGISSHFKNSPVDISAGISTNSISISDSKQRNLVDAASFAVNLQVSKELSVFTFYTGLQYENTGIEVSVNHNGTISKMEYTNENKVRGIFGLSIKLGPLNLNGDYSVGKSNTVSAGFGFAF